MLNLDLDQNTDSFVAVGYFRDVSLSHLSPITINPIIAYYEGTYNTLKWSKIIDSAN
jgi:hypothetical protein